MLFVHVNKYSSNINKMIWGVFFWRTLYLLVVSTTGTGGTNVLLVVNAGAGSVG